MKLIPQWKRAGRMFSVQAMTLATAAQLAWAHLPPELQASIPPDWLRWGTIALLALGVVGRIVDQGIDDQRIGE